METIIAKHMHASWQTDITQTKTKVKTKMRANMGTHDNNQKPTKNKPWEIMTTN